MPATKPPVIEEQAPPSDDADSGFASGTDPSASPGAQPVQKCRRQSQRVNLQMTVRIYGHGPDSKPFLEESRTLNVSADGALLTLTHSVQKNQRVLLTNPNTWQDIECRVAYVLPAGHDKFKVGLEFVSQAPNFWRVFEAQES